MTSPTRWPFLVAIMSVRYVFELAAFSCKEPFLIPYKDHVVLHQTLSFLPKVVSIFHLSEDLVRFLPCSKAPKGNCYLLPGYSQSHQVSTSKQQLLSGRWTPLLSYSQDIAGGNPASKFTITWWMRNRAYILKDKTPPPALLFTPADRWVLPDHSGTKLL